jgi:hypothetical protein
MTSLISSIEAEQYNPLSFVFIMKYLKLVKQSITLSASAVFLVATQGECMADIRPAAINKTWNCSYANSAETCDFSFAKNRKITGKCIGSGGGEYRFNDDRLEIKRTFMPGDKVTDWIGAAKHEVIRLDDDGLIMAKDYTKYFCSPKITNNKPEEKYRKVYGDSSFPLEKYQGINRQKSNLSILYSAFADGFVKKLSEDDQIAILAPEYESERDVFKKLEINP